MATTANPDEERLIKQLWPDHETYKGIEIICTGESKEEGRHGVAEIDYAATSGALQTGKKAHRPSPLLGAAGNQQEICPVNQDRAVV
jgi:hypothetical protein